MEELKDKPEESGAEVEPGEGIRLGKFRLPKRTVILGAIGLVALSLVVAGIFAYRSSARQKAVVQAQKQERVARETAAKEQEKQESVSRAKELHRAHEEVLANPSALPGIFSSPARPLLPKPEVSEKPSAPAAVNPIPPAAEQNTAEKKTAAKPLVEKTAAASKEKVAEKETAAEKLGVAAPNAAGGCALSGGKAEDYGKALGKCLEEFNRLEGRKPSNAGTPSKSD
jgi:hypothetical protein